MRDINKTIILVSCLVGIICLSFSQMAYAKVFISVEDALASVFDGASDIKKEIKYLTDEQKKIISEKAKIKFHPQYDTEVICYIERLNGKIIRYAFEDIVEGQWGPMHYLATINPSGEIEKVIILEFKERRGKPVSKRRFLKQFIGKTVKDRIKLKKDIQGVTGATISSKGVTNGIRKIVYIFNELYGSTDN